MLAYYTQVTHNPIIPAWLVRDMYVYIYISAGQFFTYFYEEEPPELWFLENKL
jgi:hypothetical protein